MENLLKLLIKQVISSKILKDFAEDILNGNIKNNNRKEIYKKKKT